MINMHATMIVKKISWNQKVAIKINTTDIKLVKLTYDVINNSGRKIAAQTAKNFGL